MQKTREAGVYAGDIELAQLGQYFGINVVVESKARKMHDVKIHDANGSLTPNLETIPGLKSNLVNRHIAGADNKWVAITKNDLIKRLSAVPQLAEVQAVINTSPRKNTPIPAHINDQTRDELLIRGIIDKPKKVFAMNIDPNYVKSRLNELPEKDLVIQEWTKSYIDSPTVYLQNESAVHWNAIHKPAEVPVVIELKPVAPYQLVEGERDVNDAINKIYDVLNAGNPPLADKVIKENFEKAFDELSQVLKNFQEKRIDLGLFKQKKEEIVTAIEQKVLSHKI